MSVIFERPFSITFINLESDSGEIQSISITSSQSLSLIHLTQEAVLHIDLTSSSENLIDFHSFEISEISISQFVTLTHFNKFQGLTFAAINQDLLTLANSFISVFLIVQFKVAITINFQSD
jgi:NADPH-dependent 7-cyano-7-deazaguanine reductase QueF-like protein